MKHTYAGVRVLLRSLRVLIQKRSTLFTLRPRPAVATGVAHATTDASGGFVTNCIKVT